MFNFCCPGCQTHMTLNYFNILTEASTLSVLHKYAHYVELSNRVCEIQVRTRATTSCVFGKRQRNPLTYRYTIGMVAWNLTPRAAAVNSGPVRRRSWRGAKLVGRSSGHWICFGAWIQSLWAGSLLLLACVSSSWKQPFKIFRFAQISTNPSGGAVFRMAQQSALPSIPKSGLTTPCKETGRFGTGVWTGDWRPHVLLEPSEHDVITGGEREEETKKSCWQEMIVFQMLHTMCYSGVVIVKSWISLCHNVINNTGCLVTANTYISSR